jgi:hypothetical protein
VPAIEDNLNKTGKKQRLCRYYSSRRAIFSLLKTSLAIKSEGCYKAKGNCGYYFDGRDNISHDNLDILIAVIWVITS